MATVDRDELLIQDEHLEQPQNESNIDWLKLLGDIIANWYWILLSVIIAMALCWLYLKKKPNVYQVQSSVLIKDQSNDVFKDQSMMSSRSSFSSVISMANNFSTELDIISSRTLIKKVVEDLDLYVTQVRTDKYRPEDLYDESPIKIWTTPGIAEEMRGAGFLVNLHEDGSLDLEGAVGSNKSKYGIQDDIKKHIAKLPATINTKYGIISITRVDSVPITEDMEISVGISAPTIAAANYKANLSVDQTNKESFLASLAINDTKPIRAIRFINRLVEAYNEDANEDKNQTAEKTAAFINSRIMLISSELGSTENAMAGFKRSAGLVDIQSDAHEALQGRTRYEQQLADNEVRLRMIQFLKDDVKANIKQNELIANIGISNDNGLTSAIAEYNKTVIERNRMARNAAESNEVIVKTDAQLQEMRNSIYKTIESLESNTKIQRNKIQQEQNRFAGAISSTPEAEKQYLNISRQRDFQSQLYLLLLQKREDNAIKLAATANNGRIIEDPEAIATVAPRRGMIKLIALLLGLAIPIGIIYLRMLLAIRITGRDDVMKLTQLPLVGDIPLDKTNNGERNIVVHENTNELMDEAFRSLRTNIQFMLRSTEKKVIMFTSAYSGEGKSTITCNLAASYAFLGKKVVVVGLDIRRPGLNKVFHFSTRLPGISQFLADPDGINLMSLLVETKISKNLSVLPGGIIPPNPTELVSQPSLEKAIEILKENFDLVILDTAPIGMVSDSQVISRVADMTVVIVRANYTYKSSVAMINNMAQQKVLPNVGITLNAVDFDKAQSSYAYRYKRYGYSKGYGHSYGHHYGYAYGYGHDARDDKRKKTLLGKILRIFRR